MATAGDWERGEGHARFTPRFPAVPGTAFAVVEWRRDPASRWSEVARVVVPDRVVAASTRVEAIDPGVEQVPANLLRFSVTFSEPMEEGSAAGRIHLRDAAGTESAGAILDMPPELWDRERRRLTVLLEPGRIKRGLQPHVQAGPPLVEGGEVTIVVDALLRNAAGSPLVSEARRTYRVGPPLRSRIDPATWTVAWPNRPQDPLTVRFDRPLDRVLALRCLRVVDEHGDPVAGDSALDPEAGLWTFRPETSVGVARELRIDTRLEDLAGNSVRRAFDRDLRAAGDEVLQQSEVAISRGR